MDPLPPNSYFETPYFQNVVPMNFDNVDEMEEPDSNINPYYLFCIKSKFQYVVPTLHLLFQKVFKDGMMKMVLSITDGGDMLSLPDEVYQDLKSKYDMIMETPRYECLVFECSHGLYNVPSWYQEYMLDCVYIGDHPYLLKRHPVTHRLGIYVDLRSNMVEGEWHYQYNDIAENITSSIEKQLIDMYLSGYIKCTRRIADKLGLSIDRGLYSDVYLCYPSWDYRTSEDITKELLWMTFA